MFIDRPSDRVQDAARDHASEPIAVVVPVSWGFGFSTPGIFAFVFGYILIGTLIGPLVSNWALAFIMCAPLALVLLQTNRGKIGQGMVAMTALEDDGRQAVVLRAKRFSALTPSGEVHRAYPSGTKVELLEDHKWWQGMRCRVGEDLYYVNPNYNGEVRRSLVGVST